MSKEIILRGRWGDVQGTLIVSDEDYDWVMQYKWHVAPGAGYAIRRYRDADGKLKRIILHRLINNTPEGKDTDHINRNRLDNRRENLRTCNESENQGNSKLHSRNTSGYRGVTFNKQVGKWQSVIRCKGHSFYLGVFDDPKDAARAYDAKSKELFGQFGYLNFTEE